MRALLVAGVLLALAVAAALWLPHWPEGELLWRLRLPRVAAAIGAGATLALAGLALQALFRNPLADPYVLGTAAGASVGGLLALMAGVAVAIGALLGAAAALALVLLLATRLLGSARDDAPDGVLLAGVMIAALGGALAQLLLAMVPDRALRGAVFWLVGDLGAAERGPGLLLVALVLAVWALGQARGLVLLLAGEREAFLAGVAVQRLRWQLLALAAIGTAAVVASCGAIGFVGLIAPQVARRWTSWFGSPEDVGRRQIGMTLLIGALAVLSADTLARALLAPLELPTGAVLALMGAPAFIVLLAHERRAARA